MRKLLISYYPNTNPNLIECSNKYSGIKPEQLFRIPLELCKKYNPIRVECDTYYKARKNKSTSHQIRTQCLPSFFLVSVILLITSLAVIDILLEMPSTLYILTYIDKHCSLRHSTTVIQIEDASLYS